MVDAFGMTDSFLEKKDENKSRCVATGPIPDGVPPRLRQPRKRGKDAYLKLRIASQQKAEKKALAEAYGLSVTELYERAVEDLPLPVFDKATALQVATLNGNVGKLFGLMKWISTKTGRGGFGADGKEVLKIMGELEPIKADIEQLRRMLKEALILSSKPKTKRKGLTRGPTPES